MTVVVRNGSEWCTNAARSGGNWMWKIQLILSELVRLEVGGRNKQAFEHGSPFSDFR